MSDEPNKTHERPKKMKVKYAPSFTESMKNIPTKEREQILAQLPDIIKEIERNPYLGTPMWGGPLNVFANWVMRVYTEIKLRLRGE